jgi:hypothetical protein
MRPPAHLGLGELPEQVADQATVEIAVADQEEVDRIDGGG